MIIKVHATPAGVLCSAAAHAAGAAVCADAADGLLGGPVLDWASAAPHSAGAVCPRAASPAPSAHAGQTHLRLRLSGCRIWKFGGCLGAQGFSAGLVAELCPEGHSL